MTYFYKFKVCYDGAFMFDPLRYDDGKVISLMNPKIDYEEFVHYIEQETGTPSSALYFSGSSELNNGLLSLRDDDDLTAFYDIIASEYDVHVFIDYYSLDLSKYVEKGTVGENEGGDEHGESSKGPNEEPFDSDDEPYESSDSDVDSVASLDHLSEWEDEMREVRRGNPIAKIPTTSQLPDLGGNRHGQDDEEGIKTAVHNDHGNFLNELIATLKSKDEETSNDPLKPLEPELPKFPTHDPSTHWRLRRPQVGELYTDHNQLRECLSYYALANGYTLWFERSCKTSLIARCGTRPSNISDPSKGKQKKHIRFPAKQQKCKFRCFARMNNEKSFQIMSLVDEHTCARNFKFGSLVNYKWIGRHFAERIRSQPEIRLCEIQNLVMKKYKCTISNHQARRARTYALTEFEKTLEEHYGMLNSYGQAILSTNPGSTVQLGTTTNPDGKTYFDRFYTCFHGLKQGWRFGCRRVVALDGCFLKKPCTGELLSAIGRDGNNQVYPIAWAIINVENKQNWTWFLQLLSHDLDCPDGAELTLISDQHKGLIEAVKDIMPRAEHRQCARHIYENFRKVYSSVEFRNLFWKAAKSTYMAQYEAAMQEIQVANPNAYKYLIERNPKSWCRAFFEIHRGCEAVENGFSECWNSVLLKIRNKPIITLLEALRVIVMLRLESMRELSENWEHDVCPAIRNKLELVKKNRACWMVIHAGENFFEVRNYSYSYTVNLDEMSCTCRMWDLSGIPCVHGIEVIYKCNRDPEDFISSWFRKSTYVQAYNKIMFPVGGMDTWPTNNLPKPLPPKPRTMPGRPKKKRIRAAHEPRVGSTKVSKHGLDMHCRNCWAVGHNARTCDSEPKERPAHLPKPKQKKQSASQPQPSASQPQPSTSQPQPSASQPQPSASQPQQSARQKNPSATQPNPSATQPNPTATQPNPSATQPNPSATQPNPSATQPNPTATQPTQESHQNPSADRPLSPRKKYVFTASGHKFVTSSSSIPQVASSSVNVSAKSKVIRKIGTRPTTTGTFTTKPYSAPRPASTSTSATQSPKKTRKAKEYVKTRIPSQRALSQRLARRVPGPGVTEDDPVSVL